MRTVFAFGLLAVVVALGGGCASAPDARRAHIEEMVEHADSASEHVDIVVYYRQQATLARQAGAEHRRLADVYGGRHRWGTSFANRARDHCIQLAAAEEARAAQYELLALEHERLSQEARP